MAEICARVGQTREVKALVITGAGDKAFAAGTDIAQFQAFKGSEDGIAYERKIDRIVDTIERCSVPTIAAIAGLHRRRGRDRGGLRPPARHHQRPVRLSHRPHAGNCLSMANYARLAALIGPQRTKEVIFLAKLIDGPTALSIGLVSESCRTPPPCTPGPRKWPHVASHAPITLQVTKEALGACKPGWATTISTISSDWLTVARTFAKAWRHSWPSGRRNGRGMTRLDMQKEDMWIELGPLWPLWDCALPRRLPEPAAEDRPRKT